jgi:hypothetical protein
MARIRSGVSGSVFLSHGIDISVGRVEHPKPKEPPSNARRLIDLNSEVKRFMMIFIREGFRLLGFTQSL